MSDFITSYKHELAMLGKTTEKMATTYYRLYNIKTIFERCYSSESSFSGSYDAYVKAYDEAGKMTINFQDNSGTPIASALSPDPDIFRPLIQDLMNRTASKFIEGQRKMLDMGKALDEFLPSLEEFERKIKLINA